jgi:hypothetical protein
VRGRGETRASIRRVIQTTKGPVLLDIEHLVGGLSVSVNVFDDEGWEQRSRRLNWIEPGFHTRARDYEALGGRDPADHRAREARVLNGSSGGCEASCSRFVSIDAFSWGHRWGHAVRDTGISGTSDPHNHAVRGNRCGALWARLDSNQGPTDYESAALTS